MFSAINRMKWLTTALQVIWFSQVARTVETWNRDPIIYVDHDKNSQDFYFDRIVALSVNEKCVPVNYGIGVHISTDRILTSFNPFRNIIREETALRHFYATTLVGRTRDYTGKWYYTTKKSRIACGRQIQDLPDHVITEGDLWHGTGNRHCPLHDLLVFRIHNDLKNSTLGTNKHNMERYPDKRNTSYTNDVFLTTLAQPLDRIGVDFKFCTVLLNVLLNVTYYTESDNALLDCDEWLPRDWGYFFCILNKYEYKQVVSGAMLVSNEMLFGVASFVLSRGKESIIVFTDIRPYYNIIQKTCTYSDSEEVRPETFPGSKYCLSTTTTISTTTTTTANPNGGTK